MIAHPSRGAANMDYEYIWGASGSCSLFQNHELPQTDSIALGEA